MSSPFEPPKVDSGPAEPTTFADRVEAELRSARPFQLGVSGVLVLTAGLLVASVVIILSYAGPGTGRTLGAACYLVGASLIAWPAWVLFQSAWGLGRPATDRDLIRAIALQVRFWRILGWGALLAFIGYALIIAVVVLGT